MRLEVVARGEEEEEEGKKMREVTDMVVELDLGIIMRRFMDREGMGKVNHHQLVLPSILIRIKPPFHRLMVRPTLLRQLRIHIRALLTLDKYRWRLHRGEVMP